jgi:hydrogenase maturation protease
MALCHRHRGKTRVLCLGNDLIADDAFGPFAAAKINERWGGAVDVVESAVSGFYLMDYFEGISRLVVIDTVLTGVVPPGTVLVLREDDFAAAAGNSPHYVGLFEALALGRGLQMEVPEEVCIIAVEAADLTTMGGPLHPDVERAVDEVMQLVGDMLEPRVVAP